jgi:DNA-binding transcriptional ArsR family regulator
MKTSVLPLFQPAPARALAFLYRTGGGIHLSELARRLGMSLTTAHHAVSLLEDTGLITSERIGGARILHPEMSSPYAEELRPLLLKAFGPETIIGDAIATVDGIEDAAIFGSWAARMQGDRGREPADIDLLIIGRPDQVALGDALREAEGLLQREIEPTIVSRREWTESRAPFLKTIKRRPMIWVERPLDA